MRVRVQLFAAARDKAGTSTVELDLPQDATVAVLRSSLVAACPQLRDIAARAMLAIDTDYARDDATVHPSSEIALIPPVSGG